ncbi:MAG: hypothetical protein CL693_06470 [Cellvibrionaceae bacterium]|nr:hypothetical protein [Cellvibrionaceae bacterium]
MATIIASEGAAAVTMEKEGSAAGISKSLPYFYFSSKTDRLKKLLTCELKALRRRQMDTAGNYLD